MWNVCTLNDDETCSKIIIIIIIIINLIRILVLYNVRLIKFRSVYNEIIVEHNMDSNCKYY